MRYFKLANGWRSRPDLLRLLNHKQGKEIPYLMLVSSMVE